MPRCGVSGAIVVIEFKQPVAVAVDRINSGGTSSPHISAARRTPDGMAIRIRAGAQAYRQYDPRRRAAVYRSVAGPVERHASGLPQVVVDELAQRTRVAEAQLNRQRLSAKKKRYRRHPRQGRQAADLHALPCSKCRRR